MRLTSLVGVALAIAIAVGVAGTAGAQTMGEYATTTAGVASGGGSISGTAVSPPITYGRDGYSGYEGGSRTWQTNGWGGSWSERVGSRNGSGGADFSSRAAAASGSSGGGDSRWPNAQRFGASGGGDSSARFGSGERFKSGDRFTSGDARFSSGDRFSSGSRFHDNMGIDTSFNSVNGN